MTIIDLRTRTQIATQQETIKSYQKELKEKDQEIEGQRKEMDSLVSFILSEYLHGELLDEIDKICIGFQQGEWYRKKSEETRK